MGHPLGWGGRLESIESLVLEETGINECYISYVDGAKTNPVANYSSTIVQFTLIIVAIQFTLGTLG